MNQLLHAGKRISLVNSFILILAGIVVVVLVPVFAHLTGVPVYMLEPMRLMLFVSIVHGNKTISYLLAGSLPVVSLLTSGHPEFHKMLIITAELLLNTYLFYRLTRATGRPFVAAAASILISKSACYLAYWPVFSLSFMITEASPVFLSVQIITTMLFSYYSGKKYKMPIV